MAPDALDAGTAGEHTATRFLSLLPALVAAELVLGAWALLAGLPTGGLAHPGTMPLAATALGSGTLALLRVLPVLFVLSWPLLRIRDPRLRLAAVATFWTVLLLLQVALEQFYLVARVPLGAELFGYSWDEIRTTAAAGSVVDSGTIIGWVLPPLVLCAGLVLCSRRPRRPRRKPVVIAVLLACAAAWAWPLQPQAGRWTDEDAYALALNKPGYFIAENIGWLRRHVRPDPLAAIGSATARPATAASERAATDTPHPFLHPDRTPDALGAYFAVTPGAPPPNLVFIVVEGLGRSFSGPDAALGSFTPFLDELAGRSLYFDNFLANQGRTFGVLPSLFGSLPFGEQGFAALGERMPPHAGLLSVLGQQGYALSFYSGWDANFDNERLYLEQQGVARIVDIGDYGPGYPRSPGANSWGYADRELVARVLADAPARGTRPSLTVMQTITMHTPYTFPGQARYRARFEQRLAEIGIPDADRAGYREHADIYSAVLYTDDALRTYFAAAARDPAHANTLYIVTGDHRLPELPMGNRIERYHVPLLVYSPMLRHPLRIRSVSSQLDVAPSLLAFLAHNYGLKRPAEATWLGTGLDLDPAFRNLHDIPLKQSKTLQPDFVSGPWFLNRGTLYALGDGMRIEPAADATAAARIDARFATFLGRNDRFIRDGVLSPEGSRPRLVAYDAAAVAAPLPALAGPLLAVRDVRVPGEVRAGVVRVDATFANDGTQPTVDFVPLVVVLDEGGREVGESSGAALMLDAGARRELPLAIDLGGLAPGRYHLAVLPSDPGSGKSIGSGRYRIALSIRD